MKDRMVGVTLAAAVFCGAACAQIGTFTGPGGPINDVSDHRFTIFVDQHVPSRMEAIWLDISHTWVGDLYIEVRHKTPADYTCILLDRPGVPQSTFGNSDNLDGVYEFRDGAAPIPEATSVSDLIVPGLYGPHTGQQVTSNLFDCFGEWSLFVSDRAGGDIGVLRSWTIQFDWVPAPGSAVVLIGSGLILRGRRR